MAKKRGRSAAPIGDAIALSAMLRPPVPSTVVIPPLVTQDERLYTPLRQPLPLQRGSLPARQVGSPGSFRRAGLRWESAAGVDICRKRKTRRAVIFAKGKSGLGAKARHRKQHAYSRISCK